MNDMHEPPHPTSNPWFHAKRFGYGSGLPCAWQGWLFLTGHIVILGALCYRFAAASQLIFALIVGIAALAPLPVYRAKTAGGWRWRGK